MTEKGVFMKRAKMRWLSILFFFLSIVMGFIALASYDEGDDITNATLIFGGIAIVLFIVFRVIWNKAKWVCKCGCKGDAIHAEYLGKHVSWSDSNDGKSSTRRVTKNYRLTLQCPSCGNQWYVKTSRSGPTDTYSY